MKAYLRTFGCRANQYDTEAVRAMILASGGEIVDTLELADVAVLNSCAVTADAEADLRRAVRGAAADRPGLPVIVMGCASARDDGRIAALAGVQHVIAGADLPAIAMALDLDPILAGTRAAVQTGSRALLRIQDGCDEHCTFCATTLARGENRSRPEALLVQEAMALSAEHPEIVITGIHIGSYGTDHGSTLGALMSRLVREVPTVRFRLSSLEAAAIAVAYSLCLTAFFYRTMDKTKLLRSLAKASKTTGVILLLIGVSNMLRWQMAYLEIPAAIEAALLHATQTPWLMLLYINIIQIFLGIFLDMAAHILITTPLFLPLAIQMGVGPVQFGMMLLLNCALGLVHPPVGTVQFVGCAIGGISIGQATRTAWPYYLAIWVAINLVTYVTVFSTWLPSLITGHPVY